MKWMSDVMSREMGSLDRDGVDAYSAFTSAFEFGTSAAEAVKKLARGDKILR